MLNLNKAVERIFGPVDPAPEYKFHIEIDGIVGGSFSECSGFKAEREILTVKEGGVNNYVHRLPGRTTYGDITLRKGVLFTIELWEWFNAGTSTCKVEFMDLTIISYSSYFILPARWYNLHKAYPVSWEASSLRADSNQLAMESVTLTFEMLEVKDWSLLDFGAKFAM